MSKEENIKKMYERLSTLIHKSKMLGKPYSELESSPENSQNPSEEFRSKRHNHPGIKRSENIKGGEADWKSHYIQTGSEIQRQTRKWRF